MWSISGLALSSINTASRSSPACSRSRVKTRAWDSSRKSAARRVNGSDGAVVLIPR